MRQRVLAELASTSIEEVIERVKAKAATAALEIQKSEAKHEEAVKEADKLADAVAGRFSEVEEVLALNRKSQQLIGQAEAEVDDCKKKVASMKEVERRARADLQFVEDYAAHRGKDSKLEQAKRLAQEAILAAKNAKQREQEALRAMKEREREAEKRAVEAVRQSRRQAKEIEKLRKQALDEAQEADGSRPSKKKRKVANVALTPVSEHVRDGALVSQHLRCVATTDTVAMEVAGEPRSEQHCPSDPESRKPEMAEADKDEQVSEDQTEFPAVQDSVMMETPEKTLECKTSIQAEEDCAKTLEFPPADIVPTDSPALQQTLTEDTQELIAETAEMCEDAQEY